MNTVHMSTRSTQSLGRSGMTLIEVMIASFVLLVVFASVLSAANYSAKVANSARAETAATTVINTKVEEMRAMPFADVEKYLTGSPPRPVSGTIATGPCKGGTWRRTVTKESGRDELLRALVAVEWTELGRPRRLEVVTFFSKHGIINKPNAATSPGTTTPGTS